MDRNELPVEPTPLIGREKEVVTLCDLLRRPEVRLMTLTGPAGVGKTRLSLQVAAELGEFFADGVFAVSLAPLGNPEQVVPTIARSLSIGEGGDQPLLVLLKSALQEKRLLLLLDNFEHVSAAALQIASLLWACPHLKALVTSQEMLHVRAEYEYAVPPLPVPNPKRLPDAVTLAQYPSVALFLARAQAVHPAFALTNANAAPVAGICARLDGLPLAIELAAARVKYFQPQVLLARLEQGLSLLSGGARDLPERQRTLRGAIAWSYELLSPREQTLFRRLAVFVDGCTPDAAAQVCAAAGKLAGDVLETLLSLVDKSLLRLSQQEQQEGQDDEPRFWMLQVLREYGLERLADAGELEVTRASHAAYYLARAEEAELPLRGSEPGRWFAQLEREHENQRAALAFLLERAEQSAGDAAWAEMAMRLSGALYWFWNIHGYYREGRGFLERALVVREGVAAPAQVKVLYAATELAICQDDFERAEALCRESLALSPLLGKAADRVTVTWQLGFVAWVQSQYAEARIQLETAAALYQELGDTLNYARTLAYVSRVYAAQGEFSQARARAQESLRLSRALGHRGRMAFALYVLAHTDFLEQADLARAEALAEQSLALYRGLGDTQYNAVLLSLQGELRLLQGEQDQARERLEESLAIFQELGDRWSTAQALLSLARGAVCEGQFAQACTRYQESVAIAREINARDLIALALEGIGTLLVTQGEPRWAVELWEAAQALRAAIGAPLPPVYQPDYESALATARATLGEETFAAALDGGKAAALEQTLDTLPRVFARLDDLAILRLQRAIQPGQGFSIEIDEQQLAREVAEITESDFFQRLLQQAQCLRPD